MDVYPGLTYRDVKAALAWLANAFGLEPRVFDDEGGVEEIHHAALMHGDGMVLIESERPEELHGSHSGRAWVYVAVGDIDGAQRGYSARDLEGNLWSFGTARPKR